MKNKREDLFKESKDKFQPFHKKLSALSGRLYEMFRAPIGVLRRRFPNFPSLGSIGTSLASFRLRRTFWNAVVAVSRKVSFTRLEAFGRARLLKIDEIRSNVLVKYIARELFLYFLVCFLFFFVVFFVNQILLLAETILKKRVPVFSVLRLIWYCLPAIIAQSGPFATLVGFLMCLGRMVTDNEVLILRASGQRYLTILTPVLVMGLLISVFSFVMNDYFLPLGTLHYNRMYRQIIVSNPAVELESHSIKRMNDSTIVIGTVDKRHVSDLVFLDVDDEGVQRMIFSKESDVLNAVSPGVLMQLIMNDAVVLLLDGKKSTSYDMLVSDTLTLNIFESSIIQHSGATSPREMTSYDLYKKISKMKTESDVGKSHLNSYNLEFNKKFSIPFGSIFFAILAFPLALVFGRKDGQTLGLIFGIIISVMYWAATILGQMFGIRGGYNGFWMMWGPNFFIGTVGMLLYVKLRKK